MGFRRLGSCATWPPRGTRGIATSIATSGGRNSERFTPSDPAVGEELGVVALAGLGPGDLLGRVELREVDDLDVVAGAFEGVLVDERARGVDAHGAREADVRLRPLAIAGRATLRGLERLAEAALADGEDVLLRVHARRERPQHVLDVVDVDILVDDDPEARA